VGCRSRVAALELEKRSPAVANGQLVETLGIETLGGVLTPLIPRGQAVPCEVTETFSRAADNQEHVEVRLFRGNAKLARDATLVGRFVIEGLPKVPRGTVNVAVTFSVTAEGDVRVAAREKPGHGVRLRRSDGQPGTEADETRDGQLGTSSVSRGCDPMIGFDHLAGLRSLLPGR
jgi:molecular chaperone DnaK (HSP70)